MGVNRISRKAGRYTTERVFIGSPACCIVFRISTGAWEIGTIGNRRSKSGSFRSGKGFFGCCEGSIPHPAVTITSEPSQLRPNRTG